MAATRTSPVDSGNLNRAFPGSTTGTVTRRITTDGLRRFFRHIGLTPLKPPSPSTALDLSDPAGFHVAEHGGMLHPPREPCGQRQRRQPLALIHAPKGLAPPPKPVCAQRDA
ncbi:MAG TPA: hypothetical protein EYP31_00560 [Roseibacterium sp.]|nr:hypothetical protein [Roseibacterium sp.]